MQSTLDLFFFTFLQRGVCFSLSCIDSRNQSPFAADFITYFLRSQFHLHERARWLVNVALTSCIRDCWSIGQLSRSSVNRRDKFHRELFVKKKGLAARWTTCGKKEEVDGKNKRNDLLRLQKNSATFAVFFLSLALSARSLLPGAIYLQAKRDAAESRAVGFFYFITCFM